MPNEGLRMARDAIADSREAVERTRQAVAASQESLSAAMEQLGYVAGIIAESRRLLDGPQGAPVPSG
jgi:hypothetical protein